MVRDLFDSVSSVCLPHVRESTNLLAETPRLGDSQHREAHADLKGVHSGMSTIKMVSSRDARDSVKVQLGQRSPFKVMLNRKDGCSIEQIAGARAFAARKTKAPFNASTCRALTTRVADDQGPACVPSQTVNVTVGQRKHQDPLQPCQLRGLNLVGLGIDGW